ncbi:crossover junction endonuclease EME1-like isoform X1 [Sinocyclocheilus rhinocerous]|uniref:Crossover junction endonuclease EME1-like n=2 Tax=Sinocyclocheilus rhinocerous TaxID=307959 RepID=A0A673L749_9TELE|nr:PREDICTED: crossover junction endonuclease EME1-like isoform X1 [Sinocyclocheilus rhinocerous]XP_016364792.1 PREDICTED: crossover junction endonuclease EME1-like isoform X1 [Sinocyclocheilus rhinocerous]XP_016364794.1 PREDICTED: crossover junction endonuclease EME1-like isoform X1 [Sinocyclocheilus rhinocerous]
MTCIGRPGFLLSDSDSSDSEELPVFDFSQSKSRQPNLVVLDSSDSEMAPVADPVSSLEVHASAGAARRDVLMVSIDSEEEEEEEEAMIPLAVRLKQKQLGLGTAATSAEETRASNAVSNGCSRLLDAPPAHHINPEAQPVERKKICSNTTRQCSSNDDVPYLTKEPPPEAENGTYLTKYKKTPAEVEAARQEALRKRAMREHQQEQKERLRMEKKALADAVKALRPEECIKHMVVTVDPGLLQLEGGGALLTSLHAMGCNCAIEKQSLPRSVTWARRSPCPQTGEMMSIPDSNTVIQVPVDDFVTMINNYCKRQCNGVLMENGVSLTTWIQGLMSRNPGRTLSLVVIDIEKYFRSQNSKCQKKYREVVLGEEKNVGLQGGQKKRRKKDDINQLPEVSRVQVEEALVDLQLQTGVQVRFLSTWKDFTDYITMLTKAVAEAPFKREQEKTGFTFCLASEWAGGQKVDRSGNGLLQVWKRQIQQLNRVSPDMASAILSAYPSPRLLAQAYARWKSEHEKVGLLADILIRRGEGVTSTTRRVGPELSKRMFLLMTSRDAHQPLDSAV